MAERADSIARRLMSAANPTGGWGYFAGKQSRVEPSCWVLAGLRGWWTAGDDEWQSFAAPHVRYLASVQRAKGFLTEADDAPPNMCAEGTAAWFAGSFGATPMDLDRLLNAIVALKGLSLERIPGSPQDSTLQAWPWHPDTFSWVEPTSWCVLALKKSRRRDAAALERLDVAHRMLENRSCQGGGWNFGNASALGQDLRPHVPPTAMGLIAVQDRRADYVDRAVQFLEVARLKEDSGLALSLTAIALRLHGRATQDVEARLVDVAPRTEAHGNQHALGAVLYALTAERHRAEAFRVA